MNSITDEINKASQQEHFKFAKELAFYLPIDNPKRIKVEKTLNELITKTTKAVH